MSLQEKIESKQRLEQDCNIIIEEKIKKISGDTQIKQYQQGKLLGKGGFAKCYELTNLETQKLLAVKIIQKDSLTKPRSRLKLVSEIKIHKALSNENIVKFVHVFEDHKNVYILLELCSNKTLNDLKKRRKKLSELEVKSYVLQIINALRYIHSNRVIHRDLKLGNLFINEKMEIKMGDFGLASKLDFEGQKRHTVCGTPNYIAPEVLDSKAGHSMEVDVWSLGVVIYTLIIGQVRFSVLSFTACSRPSRLRRSKTPTNESRTTNIHSLTRVASLSRPRVRLCLF